MYRSSEQLDSRESRVNNGDSDHKIDHLEEDTKKISKKQELNENDKERAQDNTHRHSDEQGARAALARYGAHTFGNRDSRRRRESGTGTTAAAPSSSPATTQERLARLPSTDAILRRPPNLSACRDRRTSSRYGDSARALRK